VDKLSPSSESTEKVLTDPKHYCPEESSEECEQKKKVFYYVSHSYFLKLMP